MGGGRARRDFSLIGLHSGERRAKIRATRDPPVLTYFFFRRSLAPSDCCTFLPTAMFSEPLPILATMTSPPALYDGGIAVGGALESARRVSAASVALPGANQADASCFSCCSK